MKHKKPAPELELDSTKLLYLTVAGVRVRVRVGEFSFAALPGSSSPCRLLPVASPPRGSRGWAT